MREWMSPALESSGLRLTCDHRRHRGVAWLPTRSVIFRASSPVPRYECDDRLLPSLSRVTPSASSEPFSVLLGFPIARSFPTCCVCLELRSLSSPGITRLQRYYEPLRHLTAPGPSLTGVQLVIPDHALRLPVLRTLSLCTCRRQYPGAAAGRRLRSVHPSRISLPRNGSRVGLHIDLFETCSAFTQVAACTLALSPIRDTLIEGFSHFVTSMTAPIASGWSDCRRAGLAPAGKRRLVTAHARSCHSPVQAGPPGFDWSSLRFHS